MASAFDHKFVSGRILGSDLKKFTDEMPVHERKSDLHWAQVIEVWEDLEEKGDIDDEQTTNKDRPQTEE